MERERFIEMTENIKRLSEAGALDVPVFLFAHCGATMELADELLKMEIKPEAILDNNSDKHGLNYKGIPVCEPQVAVFSVIAILVYQGALTLLSEFLQPYVSDLLIQELSACGGAMIIMIAINLLGLKKIKTANFLPALVFEILFVMLVPQVLKLFS